MIDHMAYTVQICQSNSVRAPVCPHQSLHPSFALAYIRHILWSSEGVSILVAAYAIDGRLVFVITEELFRWKSWKCWKHLRSL